MNTHEKIEAGRETVRKAKSNMNIYNDLLVIESLAAKGIPANEISPRDNVFTYNAWLSLGRQVKKGQHGVKIPVIMKKEHTTEHGQKEMKQFWKNVTVFHISQTTVIE